ncbi:MAG: 30S ribosomal protein S6 [Bacteroides sp.]|nr:30S ribosomal protein S6 [Bacillota bacterium]MCM1393321.1 30S ribosomal protein S6 [[Eubacterium] siraeum]MCM1455918.1 30S ribosomal protein S6 [Bacteroides sp.]
MDKYEILYIIRSAVDDDQKSKVVEKFENLVGTLGGTVESVDKWGLKKFAYEIDKQTEGYYVLMNVECSSDAQIEIDRQMRNDEAIIRKMIIKK